MRAVILAAGQGTRLRPLTDERPKCMVEVNGKPLIQWQIDCMVECGIQPKEILILTGYQESVIKEYINYSDITFISNPDYMTTNMVYTLMQAKNLLKVENDIILAYGDIIYKKEILQKLLSSKEALSVIVDVDWLSYWMQRMENPLEDAETLKMNKHKYLEEIGKKPVCLEDIEAQYIGLMRFQKEGVQDIFRFYKKICEQDDKAMSYDYKTMYMTDLLQGLIENSTKIKGIEINRGWYEIDCYNDLKIVENELEKGI